MVATTSGRHSRYPAVNRDIPSPTAFVNFISMPEPMEPPAPERNLDVTTMTIEEILAWVGEDSGRRSMALKKEQKGKKRKTLLAQLQTRD